MATLLPPGKTTFLDADGKPLAGGSVAFYTPGTTTPKTTWADSGGVTANTNPVILDAAGSAVIYGAGIYREVVSDAAGNQIWDLATAGNDAVTGGLSADTLTVTTLAAGNLAVSDTSSLNVVTANSLSLGTSGVLTVPSTATTSLGATTISGTLGVLGGTQISAPLSCGPLSITGDVTATGQIIANGLLTGFAAANITGLLSVAGDISGTGMLNVTGAIGAGAGLTAVGNCTINGSISTLAGLTVAGAAALNASASVNGALTVGTTLNVAGTIAVAGTFAGSTAGWAMPATGPASFSGAYNLGINSGGGVLGTTFIAASDRRVKENISPLNALDAREFVERIEAKSFTKDGTPDAGFIAQDIIEAGFQRMVVVSRSVDPRVAEGDKDSPAGLQLNLNYHHATAYHHAVIAELLHRVAYLEAQLEKLMN